MATPLSQQDYDTLIAAFFDGAGEGFFVEVGLYHPSKGSRGFALEQLRVVLPHHVAEKLGVAGHCAA